MTNTAFKEGDYFYATDKDDSGNAVFSVTRCLKIDHENEIAHVAMFSPLPNKPTDTDLNDLECFVLHMPIELGGFSNTVTFANKPVSKDDLEGYYAYLREVDFFSYLEETGADIDAVTKEAEKLFDEATKLGEQEKFAEAAAIYYDCYEMFPVYFEALDNAALCLMECGEYEDAIECFLESIEKNDETFMTNFHIGICYHELDDVKLAREWYDKTQNLPDLNDEQRADLKEVVAQL